jgi:hypothetical protein
MQIRRTNEDSPYPCADEANMDEIEGAVVMFKPEVDIILFAPVRKSIYVREPAPFKQILTCN